MDFVRANSAIIILMEYVMLKEIEMGKGGGSYIVM